MCYTILESPEQASNIVDFLFSSLNYCPPQMKIMQSRPSLKRNDGDVLTYIRHAM